MKLLSVTNLPAAVFAIALFTGFSATPAANAATDAVYKYSVAKNGVFAISPLAMAPYSNNTNYIVNLTGEVTTTAGGGCFNTGVNLPASAKIASVSSFYSSTVTNAIEIFLFRYKFSDGTREIIAHKTLPDATGTRKSVGTTIAPGFEMVNNTLYNYAFTVCLSNPNDKFYGARVHYTYENAGD